jgi:hypothetical protein
VFPEKDSRMADDSRQLTVPFVLNGTCQSFFLFFLFDFDEFDFDQLMPVEGFFI